jgi:hypothetical protein
MAVESEKEFNFNTKFSFHADYADTPADDSNDKTSQLATKIKEILSKLKMTFGNHIQIRNWEGKTVELTEFSMLIDSLKKRCNYENNEKLQCNISLILILKTTQPWRNLKEHLLPWLNTANLFMNHHLFKTTKTNTS